MWNEHRSIRLSKWCVTAFLALILIIAATAPWLLDWALPCIGGGLLGEKSLFLFTIYTGLIPAVVLLLRLFGLLRRIVKEQVFVRENVESLRTISWCCFAGSAMGLVSAAYYIPWGMVGVAAAFMGLIVRVVKNVFAKAVELQDEADLTI